ncbi:cadherin-89D [Leptidea sinapis]|uniref:cadherin-89D n=1 Tax=Leptidea sinapis TaxID=189913 RepID=UPI0021C3A267|nr:cadherin-89D [Leptidea sinapis]
MRAWTVLLTVACVGGTLGCNFYPVGEYLKFVRIPENLQVGEEVLKVEVHPRKNLVLQAVERSEDAHMFTYRDLNRTHVAVVLAQSVDHLVDSAAPQNVLKFRLGCDFDSGDDLISAYLSVTVYIEDINDNSPVFLDAPYTVTVDELTPTGLTIFKHIRALDRDKPNTPNSDIHYSIIAGDEEGRFALESSNKPALVLRKPLDFDSGDREFLLTLVASDSGSPPRSTNTTLLVIVQDNDDLPPKFTLDVYKTKIPEFYPLLGKRIHQELSFEHPIRAFDQDSGVAAPVRYELISGNERRLFSLSALNGSLFLDREIDLDAETGLPANTFMLQIQASQVDNPLKSAQARVEIEVLDLNDNLPDFEVDFYNISIVENLPNGFSVLQVMATDKDQGDNGEFSYQLNDPHQAFSIDPRTGWLTVKNQTVLDREEHSSLRMKVYANEKNPSIVGTFLDKQRLSKWRRGPTTPKFTSSKEKTTYVFPDKIGTKSENIEYFEDKNQLMSFVTVEVTLLDANDNNPIFIPSNLYEFTIRSNANMGDEIGKVKAVDPDLGRNGMVLYDLQRTSNLTVTSSFQIDAQTGTITLAESPLLGGRHALFIEASDQPANPSERRYSLAVVTIDVINVNKGTHADKPDFIGAPYEFWVGSNVGIGTSVGQIKVNEVMKRSELSYDLLHGYEDGVPFAVEERSGVITVIDELAKYPRPVYDFEALAIQEKLNVTISTNTSIHIVDVNDEREGHIPHLCFTLKRISLVLQLVKYFKLT